MNKYKIIYFFSFEDSLLNVLRLGVVYKYPCTNCASAYYGSTIRTQSWAPSDTTQFESAPVQELLMETLYSFVDVSVTLVFHKICRKFSYD